jgi:hypothetical protein
MLSVGLVGCSAPHPSTPASAGSQTASSTQPATPTAQEPAQPTPAEALNALAEALQQREHDRRDIHDAIQLAIAACMTQRGFKYAPIPYPGTLGENPGENGLTQDEHDKWTTALIGEPIPPDAAVESDPSILIAKGPDSTFYMRRDACTTRGRTAIYGDYVKWRTTELTIDHLENQAIEQAADDKQRQTQTEAQIAAENAAVINQYARLQDSAIAKAHALLAKPH